MSYHLNLHARKYERTSHVVIINYRNGQPTNPLGTHPDRRHGIHSKHCHLLGYNRVRWGHEYNGFQEQHIKWRRKVHHNKFGVDVIEDCNSVKSPFINACLSRKNSHALASQSRPVPKIMCLNSSSRGALSHNDEWTETMVDADPIA